MSQRLAVSMAHCAGMGDLVFAEGGAKVVTCGADAHIKVIDAGADDASSARVVEDADAKPIRALAMNPDGDTLACGTEAGVKLYAPRRDFASDGLVFRSTLPVNQVAFSQSGIYLGVVSGEDSISLVNTLDTKQVIRMDNQAGSGGHDGGVLSLAFDPKGEFLVTCGADRSVVFWSVDRRASARTVRFALDASVRGDGARCRAAWRPDGAFVAVPGAKEVRLFSRDTLEEEVTLHEDGHRGVVDVVAWSPNGRYLASAASDNQILVWDLDRRETIQRYRHESPICALAWHPAANTLAAMDLDGQYALCHSVVPGHMPAPHKEAAPAAALAAPAAAAPAAAAAADEGEDGQVIGAPKDAPAATGANNADEAAAEGKPASAPTGEEGPAAEPQDGEEAPVKTVKRSARRLRSLASRGFDDGKGGVSLSKVKAQYGFLQDSEDEVEDDEYISGGEGAGGVLRTGGARHSGGLVAAPSDGGASEMQDAVQAGATPLGFKRRYLAWNTTGVITTRDEDTFHSVEVEFSDASKHRTVRFNDHYAFSMAALGDHGAFFAAPARTSGEGGADDDVPSTVFFRPFSGWAHNSEWLAQLLPGEEAAAVAVGDKWAAVATSAQYVRVFRYSGLQVGVFAIPGPVVAVAGHGPLLAVAYHRGMPFAGRQCLGYCILDVTACEGEAGHATSTALAASLASGDLPLRQGVSLSWFAFSDHGMLVAQDSLGLFQGALPLFGWQWAPILDTRSKIIGRTAGAYHWPVAVRDNKLMCVICKVRFARGTALPGPRATALPYPTVPFPAPRERPSSRRPSRGPSSPRCRSWPRCCSWTCRRARRRRGALESFSLSSPLWVCPPSPASRAQLPAPAAAAAPAARAAALVRTGGAAVRDRGGGGGPRPQGVRAPGQADARPHPGCVQGRPREPGPGPVHPPAPSQVPQHRAVPRPAPPADRAGRAHPAPHPGP